MLFISELKAQTVNPPSFSYNEPFVPQFHFSPPSEWMNDLEGWDFSEEKSTTGKLFVKHGINFSGTEVSFSDKFAGKPQLMPLSLEKSYSFRIIIDKSSVEILLNEGKYSMTNQVFPNGDFNTLEIRTFNSSNIHHLKINSIETKWGKNNAYGQFKITLLVGCGCAGRVPFRV